MFITFLIEAELPVPVLVCFSPFWPYSGILIPIRSDIIIINGTGTQYYLVLVTVSVVEPDLFAEAGVGENELAPGCVT